MKTNFSIRTKMFLSLGTTVAVGTALFLAAVNPILKALTYGSSVQNLKTETELIKDMVASGTDAAVRNYLRGIAEKTEALEESYYRSYKSGELSEAQAKSRFARAVLDPSYGKIGQTGYLAVLDSKGIAVIHPYAQGKDLSYVDAVREAMQKKVGFFTYQFQHEGDAAPREKAAYVSYFAPWDSIIFASSYTSEFSDLVDIRDFREQIAAIKVGKTGYPFILDSKGNFIIHPTMQGQNAYDDRDENGRYFVREMIKRGNGLISYRWKGPGESRPREEIVAFDTYAPLGLTLGVGVYADELYGLANSVMDVIFAGMALTLAAILLVVFFLSRLVTKPVLKIQDTINSSLVKGDLTKALEVRSSDELGLLSKDFNAFIAQLRVFIDKMRETGLENRQNGSELSHRLEESLGLLTKLFSATELIREETVRLVGIATESSAATEQIAATTVSFSDRINDQAGAVSQTSASIEEISASIQNVLKIVNGRLAAETALKELTAEGVRLSADTSTTVSDFAQRADSMQDMIRTINDVAKQTNLLAMNAAIEAAHAGEYGRGFAVVADEIRKLAESTARQSKEISATLKQLISQVILAQTASGRSGEAFQSIARDIEASVDASRQIATAMQELSTGSSEIVGATGMLFQITEEIRSGSQEIRKGSEQIRDSLGETRKTAERVAQALEQIQGGVTEVNVAQLRISDINSKTNASIDELQNDFKSFSTGSHLDGLGTGSLDVAGARLHHKEWVLKVSLALNGAMNLNAAEASSPKRCALGKWLYEGGGRERYRGFAKMGELEELHDRIHATVGEILSLDQQGQKQGIATMLGALGKDSDSMIQVLSELEREFD
ncbi:MAG TPA: cache domain-containing protein [Rectinemataceae bacterium]|nr:cache domain-containing protein [Rectinemataceae bacterium]